MANAIIKFELNGKSKPMRRCTFVENDKINLKVFSVALVQQICRRHAKSDLELSVCNNYWISKQHMVNYMIWNQPTCSGLWQS